MTAYARPDLPFEQWWAGLQPLLDNKATQDYAYMDPARIVATSVTGPAVITDDTSAYVAFVDVPTNAGTYGVVLSRADADSPWLAGRFILPSELMAAPKGSAAYAIAAVPLLIVGSLFGLLLMGEDECGPSAATADRASRSTPHPSPRRRLPATATSSL